MIEKIYILNFYSPLYKQFFGGVVALKREQYMQINGFSNYYWGWGLEDDDMSIRSVGLKKRHRKDSFIRF
jgi:hypothetical protein